MSSWPTTTGQLIQVQESLKDLQPPLWIPEGDNYLVGGCFVCFNPGTSAVGAAGDTGWAGAALWRPNRTLATASIRGMTNATYQPGLLALREGYLLEEVVRALPDLPDVLLVNATGRDHPRRAGLALHLGNILEVPTVGVTNRSLEAKGDWPPPSRGSVTSLMIGSEHVGSWVRTQTGGHPLAVHPGWRTDMAVALEIVLSTTPRFRTPEPLRQARCAARTARSKDIAGSWSKAL
ncbi:MAG: endonuclease V [Fidelibacterota bacterium]|nr:MAG: endonuclease V [Candidatus Neomarinimicrobiota bacterium]